jgi:hypothetical protein
LNRISTSLAYPCHNAASYQFNTEVNFFNNLNILKGIKKHEKQKDEEEREQKKRESKKRESSFPQYEFPTF